MAIQRSPWWKVVLRNCIFFSGLLITSCSNGEVEENVTEKVDDVALSGEVLYMNHCASCHGSDGKLGISGASDLSESKMSVQEIKDILKKGRNGMPVMKEILGSEENLESVSNYVIELEK